jgi:hypothetical protein
LLLHCPLHVFLAHLITQICVFFRPPTTVAAGRITAPHIFTPRCVGAGGW